MVRFLMSCIAVISDDEGDSMLDDEPALKDLRVVLQRCDDLVPREYTSGLKM